MCMFAKQSLRDGRSMCAKFHTNALCLSAFTQLLNNTCMIREKLTPMYKIYKILYTGWLWEYCSHIKNTMTYFFSELKVVFFSFLVQCHFVYP